MKVITEINPLDVAEMLGNIGGFWGETTEVPLVGRGESAVPT